MAEWLTLILSGIAVGGAYILMGVSIVLMFRSTAVINFSHGDMSALGAFVFLQLAVLDDVPVVVGVIVGAVATAACSAAFGLFAERMTVRGGALVPLVASFGILLALNGLVVKYWAAHEPYVMPSPTKSAQLHLFGASVAADAAVGFAAALVLCAVLGAVYRWSPIGLQLRALVSNPTMTELLGIDTRRLRLMAWSAAGVLGFAAAMLFSTETYLQTSSLDILLLKGFAAAAVGGFVSFGAAIVGGVGLGVAEAVLARYVGGSLTQILAVVIVSSLLVVFPRGLFTARLARA